MLAIQLHEPHFLSAISVVRTFSPSRQRRRLGNLVVRVAARAIFSY